MQVNILGFGNMGQAIAKALLANRFSAKIIVSDKSKVAASGVSFDADFRTLARADVVIIAVKPQDVPVLAGQVRGKIRDGAVVVSIAAGLKINKLKRLFRHGKIVRVMPNLGLSVGQGIAAWKSAGLLAAEKRLAQKFLNAVSENFEVGDEKLIDAVTAISGSGPAYFFYFAESLGKAARRLGLSQKQSLLLVSKTMAAAAELQGEGDYQALIAKVRSKKGTTDAALKVFQKRKFFTIVNQAVTAAHRRAEELSK
ncbi:MAG: pyrroline-5-carboxylate reductase [Patescibacteria group bacterium]|nr:pyrroline-5-carboxylate reductase [Patescibacteria group bacterium]